jgi:hypothetical protein
MICVLDPLYRLTSGMYRLERMGTACWGHKKPYDAWFSKKYSVKNFQLKLF